MIAFSGLLATAPAVRGAQLLAAGTDDKDRASPIGLFVVLALCIAVYFLWKSMNRHLKKLPTSFDHPEGTDPADPDRAAGMGDRDTEVSLSKPPAPDADGARTRDPQ